MNAMSCNECGHIEKSSSQKETMDKMWKHLQKEHPSVAAEISLLPKDEQESRLEEEVQEVS